MARIAVLLLIYCIINVAAAVAAIAVRRRPPSYACTFIYPQNRLQRLLHLKPTLEQIDSCIWYCARENDWLPPTRFFSLYSAIGDCVESQLGYRYSTRAIKKYIQYHRYT